MLNHPDGQALGLSYRSSTVDAQRPFLSIYVGIYRYLLIAVLKVGKLPRLLKMDRERRSRKHHKDTSLQEDEY